MSDLKIEDTVTGSGAEAATGNTVVVHYTGTFLDGKKFDSSVDRNQPFSLLLEKAASLRVGICGVAGMKVGGKRVLTIPPELAYGSKVLAALSLLTRHLNLKLSFSK